MKSFTPHRVSVATFGSALYCLIMIGCGSESPTAIAPTLALIQSPPTCSVRGDAQVPSYANNGWVLPLDAYFPCGAIVKINDPTGNATVAGAVDNLRAAMQGGISGIPDISTSPASYDHVVNVVFSGGNGPWSGQVIFSGGLPSTISLSGSCTNSCGSLVDVVLNELTQLYGLADVSTASKWDTFGTTNVTDHCAALGPAAKAWTGTICRFEIEAVWWKYGLISQMGASNKHIITGFVPPLVVPLDPYLGAPGYPSTAVPMPPHYATTPLFGGGAFPNTRAIISSFRPLTDYGNPSLCTVGEELSTPAVYETPRCSDLNEELLSYTWTVAVGDYGPTTIPRTTFSGPTIQIEIATTYIPFDTLSTSVGPSSIANLTEGVALPEPGSFFWVLMLPVLAPPSVSLSPAGCTSYSYGTKTYVTWSLSWTSAGVPSSWGWEILESPTSATVDGTIIGSGTSGEYLELPTYIANYGPTFRHYFIRLGGASGTGWVPAVDMPLQVSDCVQ